MCFQEMRPPVHIFQCAQVCSTIYPAGSVTSVCCRATRCASPARPGPRSATVPPAASALWAAPRWWRRLQCRCCGLPCGPLGCSCSLSRCSPVRTRSRPGGERNSSSLPPSAPLCAPSGIVDSTPVSIVGSAVYYDAVSCSSPDTSPVSSPEPSFRPRLPTYFLSLRNGTRIGNEDYR